MRPYLAIIKDSFREAIASRVLWILLGLIVFALLLLFPLSYKRNLTTEFSLVDFDNPPEFVSKLREAGERDEPTPGKRIWSLLEDDTRKKLDGLRPRERGDNPEFMPALNELRTSLSKLIQRKDFYDEAYWNEPSLSKEARDYLERPRNDLSKEELARLNRLLIENPFSSYFHGRASKSIVLTYFGFNLSWPLPFSNSQVKSFIEDWILATFMSLVVGVAGIITALLVTSTIIPQMFDPGSITLLLSKPISRSLLFISKFLGGCAFILLNVGVLISGLWLFLGTRFGIWNHGMLWYIPIFLFLFLIYYSVSALTGLIWKSPIISVVLTVIFWFVCFSVGTTKGIMEAVVLDSLRFTKIARAGDDLVAVSEAGVMHLWDDEKKEWVVVFEPRGEGMPAMDGPYYDTETKQLLFGHAFRNPFGFGQSNVSFRIARSSDGWKPQSGPHVPAGTAALLVAADGGVLAVAGDNVYRLQGKPAPLRAPIKVFGLTLPLGQGSQFRPLVADGLSLEEPIAAAADPREPRVVICSGNEVLLLQGDDEALSVRARKTLKGEERDGSVVAVSSSHVLVARADGTIWLLDADDLSVKSELKLEQSTQPRFAGASPDGTRLAVLFQNRRLWLIDANTGEQLLARVSGQGDISGFAFSENPQSGAQLLVADRGSRVTTYDLASLERVEVRRPATTRAQFVYYNAVLPLYVIFPKPGELTNTAQYALTGERTTAMGLFQGDLSQRREDLHPWRPVTSGLAFVAVVLLIACIYIERHEF